MITIKLTREEIRLIRETVGDSISEIARLDTLGLANEHEALALARARALLEKLRDALEQN